MEELSGHQIECYFFGDLFLNVYNEHYSPKWFRDNEKNLIDTVDLLEDERSKQIYSNAICIRISPQFAN